MVAAVVAARILLNVLFVRCHGNRNVNWRARNHAQWNQHERFMNLLRLHDLYIFLNRIPFGRYQEFQREESTDPSFFKDNIIYC